MFDDDNSWLIHRLAKSLYPTGRKAGRIIILFDTPQSANGAAFMLSADWDGCNSRSIKGFDDEAIKTAASLEKAEFCYCGDYCQFPVETLEN